MGLRFSRRVTILPGVRMNFGLRGASLSLGPRGASVNIGRRGIFGNVGLPGTGLSYRGRLSPPARRRSAARMSEPPPTTTVAVNAKLEPDGSVVFADSDGAPASPERVKQVFAQSGDAVRAWLDEHARDQGGSGCLCGCSSRSAPPRVSQRVHAGSVLRAGAARACG